MNFFINPEIYVAFFLLLFGIKVAHYVGVLDGFRKLRYKSFQIFVSIVSKNIKPKFKVGNTIVHFTNLGADPIEIESVESWYYTYKYVNKRSSMYVFITHDDNYKRLSFLEAHVFYQPDTKTSINNKVDEDLKDILNK